MKEALKFFTSGAFIISLIVIVATFVILNFIKKYLIKKVAYTTKGEQHQNTFIGVVFNILQYVVIIICIIIVLKLNGVDVASIVTGLGIVGALVGLALQDTMKDIISGVNIYNNNFYKVGDYVFYQGKMCQVKYFSARVTKFQELITNNTFTVCNSTINSIEKVKKNINLYKFTFDFDLDQKKINKCLENAAKKLEGRKFLRSIAVIGVTDITEDGCVYGVAIDCAPRYTYDIKSEYYAYVYEEFKKAKISPNFNDYREIKLTDKK